MKQEYLMLSHIFKPMKQSVAGWFVSEKLDGIRAYWDGGLSRGLPASEVPYANTVKDFRLNHQVMATGLWTRTGKVIYAPDYWLNQLPPIPLDGELYIGPNSFQELTSIVSKKDGSSESEWPRIVLQVFDSPPYTTMFARRKITVRDYDFRIEGAIGWHHDRLDTLARNGARPISGPSEKWYFELVQGWLKRCLYGSVAVLHKQIRLPLSHPEAIVRVEEILKSLVEQGSEGVMLRKATSFWLSQRSHLLLKHKPWQDAEATIIGYTSGRETDKGSRLLGMIGALIVDFQGKRLELSGLTDEERQFAQYPLIKWAEENPGKDMPNWAESKHFNIGQTITFKYRELSVDGVPKEGRYWRKA